MANMNLLNIQTFVFQVWSVPSRLQVPACVFVFAPALLSKTHLALLCFFRARGLCATTWRFVGRSLALSTSLSPSLSTSLLFLSHTTCCNRRLSSKYWLIWFAITVEDIKFCFQHKSKVFPMESLSCLWGVDLFRSLFLYWPIDIMLDFLKIFLRLLFSDGRTQLNSPSEDVEKSEVENTQQE